MRLLRWGEAHTRCWVVWLSGAAGNEIRILPSCNTTQTLCHKMFSAFVFKSGVHG